jgi:PAS domain S-box-containing protein
MDKVDLKLYNIVLLDLGLPDSNGIETLKAFKAHTLEVPVIVLTGLDDEAAGIEAIQLGAEDYLVKGQVNERVLIKSLEYAAERYSFKHTIEHYYRVLRAIRNISHILVNEKNPQTLIEQVCQKLIDTRGYNAVWIALGNCQDPTTVFASAGYGEAFDHMSENLSIGNWPTCVKDALKSDNKTFLIDTKQSCQCILTQKYGHDMGGVCILQYGQEILGCIAISFPGTIQLGKEEKTMLQEIARDLTYTLHDIQSEQLQQEAEEHIQNQARFLQLLMDAIPIPIFYKDTTGVFIGCNDAFTEFVGLSKKRIIGKKDSDIFPANPTEYSSQKERELMHHPGIQQYEAQLTNFQGSIRHVLINRAKFQDVKGNLAGIIGVMVDYTERREMEKRLQQSQKLESIGTLAGGIAHDFNNILSAILGYTQLALDEVEHDKHLEDSLQEVQTAGNRARDLVKQILTISRHDYKEFKPIRIGPLTKEAFKMLRSTIPSTIQFNEHISQDDLVVNAEPTQIHQVIINLVTNARQAIGNEPGLVEVDVDKVLFDTNISTIYPDLSPGKYARITISDNGKGIANDVVEKIFEPYFTTKSLGEGSGLGLSVVEGIVKSHHGHITVHSEPGKGTRFRVYLPVLEDRSSVEKQNMAKIPVQRGNEHILLVDDEVAIVRVQQRILESLGYQVSAYTSSKEAIEVFKATPDTFDIVITDMTMPIYTGIHLAEQIKTLRADIPVILCTGYSEQIQEKGQSQAIDGLLMKPIPKEKIGNMIRELLDSVKEQSKPVL